MAGSTSNGFVRILGRFRVWLVAAVIWLSVVAAYDIDLTGGDYETAPRLWARNAGILASYFVLVAVLRVLWPMRMAGSDGQTLVGGGRTHRVLTFTGTSHSASRSAVTTTTATQTLRTDLAGDVYGKVDLQQNTVTTDQFSLTALDGVQHTVQVRGANVPVGDGQLLTAAWAVPVGSSRGRYLLVQNHSTKNATWVVRDGLGPIALGGPRAVAFGLISMVLAAGLLAVGGSSFGIAEFFIGLGCYAVVSWAQIALFRSVTSGPLWRRIAAEGQAATAERARLLATPVAARTAQAPTPMVVPPPPAPAAPAPSMPAPPSVPPGWLPDPTGRHEHRYWSGSIWTEHVSDRGVAAVDPP